jgi:hypothetical protein
MLYASVCPRCDQWQNEPDGDCQNACAARGLAAVAHRVKVPGHESELCRHLDRIGVRSEAQKLCLDCGRIVEPAESPGADRNCPHTHLLDASDEDPGSRWVCADCDKVVHQRGSV